MRPGQAELQTLNVAIIIVSPVALSPTIVLGSMPPLSSHSPGSDFNPLTHELIEEGTISHTGERD